MSAARIHPSAIVDPHAELGDDVEIGPYAVIDGPVRIGAGTRIGPYVHISGDTVLGERNVVHAGAAIGDLPQDLKYDLASPSGVRIGGDNVLREHVTIHRATTPGAYTTIGDRNFLMVGSHVGHDCRLGDRNILANQAMLGGHVVLENRVNIAGGVPVHQFCRVGELAMMWGYSACSHDVPPYMTVHGRSRIVGINTIGLRRAPDITREELEAVRRAFKVLFRSDLGLSAALTKLEAGAPPPAVQRIIDFCRADSKRGICQPGRRGDVEVH